MNLLTKEEIKKTNSNMNEKLYDLMYSVYNNMNNKNKLSIEYSYWKNYEKFIIAIYENKIINKERNTIKNIIIIE